MTSPRGRAHRACVDVVDDREQAEQGRTRPRSRCPTLAWVIAPGEPRPSSSRAGPDAAGDQGVRGYHRGIGRGPPQRRASHARIARSPRFAVTAIDSLLAVLAAPGASTRGHVPRPPSSPHKGHLGAHRGVNCRAGVGAPTRWLGLGAQRTGFAAPSLARKARRPGSTSTATTVTRQDPPGMSGGAWVCPRRFPGTGGTPPHLRPCVPGRRALRLASRRRIESS